MGRTLERAAVASPCFHVGQCAGRIGERDNLFPLPHYGAPGAPRATPESRGGECLPCGPTRS